eukprot:1178550-Prorocentrum_minimum.AAC.2
MWPRAARPPPAPAGPPHARVAGHSPPGRGRHLSPPGGPRWRHLGRGAPAWQGGPPGGTGTRARSGGGPRCPPRACSESEKVRTRGENWELFGGKRSR